MGLFDEVKKKATELADQHPDTLEKISDQVIDKAGDVADTATHGKFTSQIDGAQEKADQAIGE